MRLTVTLRRHSAIQETVSKDQFRSTLGMNRSCVKSSILIQPAAECDCEAQLAVDWMDNLVQSYWTISISFETRGHQTVGKQPDHDAHAVIK